MDQSYIGRWIVRLDGYHMIIEQRMRDKHQNADNLSKKTEFYERFRVRAHFQVLAGRHNVGSGRSGPTVIRVNGYRSSKTDGDEPNHDRVWWHQ